MALRVEQGEFVDFLFGGQQVAFYALGKQGQRVAFDAEAEFFQTAPYPLRQGGGADGFGFEHDASGRQCAEPFGLRLGFFQLGQHDDGYGVFGQAFGQRLQGFAAVFTGFAAGNMDFQQFQVGKQSGAACRLQQFVPIERIVCGIDFAVEVALPFGGSA